MLPIVIKMQGNAPPARLSAYRLLTASDIAESLAVSRAWVYKAARAGRLPCVHVGGSDGPLRFIEEDVVAHLEEARRRWRPGRSSAEVLGGRADDT